MKSLDFDYQRQVNDGTVEGRLRSWIVGLVFANFILLGIAVYAFYQFTAARDAALYWQNAYVTAGVGQGRARP